VCGGGEDTERRHLHIEAIGRDTLAR
jgi:hypothetical protein